MKVDRMADEFLARLHAAGGSVERPDAQLAWRAFVGFVRCAVELGDTAPNMTEDFIMFDHDHEDGQPPLLRLVRTIGFADEGGDYTGSQSFECFLDYDEHPDITALPIGALSSSTPPERPSREVEAFVRKVEASEPFRVLVVERRATAMGTTPPELIASA